MKLSRRNYMVGQEHIAKLKGIKKATGASHSHSVRKGIELLPETPRPQAKSTRREQAAQP